jgi:uncharacterized protein YcfJ
MHVKGKAVPAVVGALVGLLAGLGFTGAESVTVCEALLGTIGIISGVP